MLYQFMPMKTSEQLCENDIIRLAISRQPAATGGNRGLNGVSNYCWLQPQLMKRSHLRTKAVSVLLPQLLVTICCAAHSLVAGADVVAPLTRGSPAHSLTRSHQLLLLLLQSSVYKAFPSSHRLTNSGFSQIGVPRRIMALNSRTAVN